jgi:RNA polymerase sigma-70 factor (ECF subfamily)
VLRQTSASGAFAVSHDWRRTYDQHATTLVRYLAKLTGDREVAAELTQETFVRAIRSALVLPDAYAARAWVFRTATNLARNELRRRRIIAFVPFTGREHAPREAFDASADQVRAALRSLPFEQATTLLLHYYGGFQRGEIAQMHGVSEETVKSRLARGRKNFVAAYRRRERGLAR